MKAIQAYETAQAYSDFQKLPAGAYICKIIDAKVENTGYGDRLVIAFDIIEGDYTNYFQRQYRVQNEPKKWKGVLRLNLIEDESNQNFEWASRAFKTAMEAIGESNPNYDFFTEWNEDTLKGKIVGAIFQEREWEMNGKTGFTAQCHSFRSVEKIRNGGFRIPEQKRLVEKQQSADIDFSEVSDMSLPF